MFRIAKAVYDNCYRLNYRSQRYGDQAAGLINRDKKRIVQMMRRYLLSRKDPICVITFLCNLKRICISINVHESEAMCLLPIFKYRSAESALIFCL